jgi:hypothetical protein
MRIAENQILYRNPSTGAIEFKELTEKLPYQRYVRNEAEELTLKEFASDAQLALLRIADPVSTALVQGYMPQTELIGDQIFTPVKMAKESGKFPAFGDEAFVIPTNLKREVGGKVARILTQSGSISMSLSEYALGTSIENRERNEWAGSPESLINMKLNTVASKIALLREKNQAVLATTNGSYLSGLSTSGASKAWASTGDAVKDMLDLIELVQSYNGVRPNVVWFSPAAWALWRRNTSVLDLLKYQGTPIAPAQVTKQGTAALLEVSKCLVGYAVHGTGGKGGEGGKGKAALTKAFLWDSVQSSNAGCAIVGTGGGIEPAFGYTYERLNSPIVESYYENSTKSQVWDYEHFFDAAVTKTNAGGQYYSLA